MTSLLSVILCLLIVSQISGKQIDYDFDDTNVTNDSDFDYDYEECSEESNSFVDKVMKMREQNKNISDDNFDIEANSRLIIDQLFDYKLNKVKLMEIMAQANGPNISKKCSHAFSTIFEALERSELWALKCKSLSKVVLM